MNSILKFLISKSFLVLIILITGLSEKSHSQAMSQSDTSRFMKYLPDYIKLQYAGGIGFVSTGVGYTAFKNKLDVTLFYSYIPHIISSDDLHSISLQFTVKPFHYKVFENAEILPFNLGFFIHNTFGSRYWIRQPAHYPKNYYWWAPGRNAGLFLGGEIKTKLLSANTPASGLAFYYRVGSRVSYLVSYIGNNEIPLKEVIELGFGVAVYR